MPSAYIRSRASRLTLHSDPKRPHIVDIRHRCIRLARPVTGASSTLSIVRALAVTVTWTQRSRCVAHPFVRPCCVLTHHGLHLIRHVFRWIRFVLRLVVRCRSLTLALRSVWCILGRLSPLQNGLLPPHRPRPTYAKRTRPTYPTRLANLLGRSLRLRNAP